MVSAIGDETNFLNHAIFWKIVYRWRCDHWWNLVVSQDGRYFIYWFVAGMIISRMPSQHDGSNDSRYQW